MTVGSLGVEDHECVRVTNLTSTWTLHNYWLSYTVSSVTLLRLRSSLSGTSKVELRNGHDGEFYGWWYFTDTDSPVNFHDTYCHGLLVSVGYIYFVGTQNVYSGRQSTFDKILTVHLVSIPGRFGTDLRTGYFSTLYYWILPRTNLGYWKSHQTIHCQNGWR